MKQIVKSYIDELIVDKKIETYVKLINPRCLSFDEVKKAYWQDGVIGDIMLWLITASFTCLVLLIVMAETSEGLEKQWLSESFPFFLCIFVSLVSTFIVIHGHLALHFVVPGRKQRDLQVTAKIEILLKEHQDKYFSEYDLKKELVDELNDPKKFCQKYFSKKASGFIDFYTKRVFNFDKTIDFDFLYYSLLIPKRKELSVDALRKILLVRKKILPLPIRPSLAKSELLFTHYSLSQIEALFTLGKGDDYFRELLDIGPSDELPIYSNFSEAQDLRTIKRKIHHLKLKELDGQTIGRRYFKVLKSKEAYQQASNDFSNCVKAYFENKSDIVVVFQDNLPYACLEIRGGNISEMSAHRNTPVIDDHSLRKEVESFLK